MLYGCRVKQMVMQTRKTTRPVGEGYEAILNLKRTCHFEFFHGSRFPLQATTSTERCFIFKMSTTGPGSGIDIIRRMDKDGNGDLHQAWVCFDHVHRVDTGWHTMGAHVYDHM